ncbi:2,3-diketo-L-gulonate TRAP transporter, substrate-binding periplasmic protein [Escherichia coli]|nr:2,3-diketo-L-gulonate TRAP transporter, substrate-binding periplasmic protein [Escherichia coli]
MKLRSVTYALFIAGLAAFSTSSLAAQSLRFGYETSQTDSQHIAAKKFNDLLQERTKGELKLKLFPDSTLGNAQAMISGVRGGTIDMEMSGSNNFAGLSPVMNLLDCIDSLEVRKKPGGHWIIRDLMGLDLVGLASL